MNQVKVTKTRHYVVDGKVVNQEIPELYVSLLERGNYSEGLEALLRRFASELSKITALKVRARSGRVLVSAGVEYGSVVVLKGGDVILNEEYAERVFQDCDGDSGFWVTFDNVKAHTLTPPSVRVEGDVWEKIPTDRPEGKYLLWVKYPVSQSLPLLKVQTKFANEQFASLAELENYIYENVELVDWSDPAELEKQARKRLMPNNAGIRHSYWDMWGETQSREEFFSPVRAWDTEVNGMKGASKDSRSAGSFMVNTSGVTWTPEYSWFYRANKVMSSQLADLLWLTEPDAVNTIENVLKGLGSKFASIDAPSEAIDPTKFKSWTWKQESQALETWDFLVENNLIQIVDLKSMDTELGKMVWQTICLNNVHGEPVAFVETKRGDSYQAHEDVLGYAYVLPPVLSYRMPGNYAGKVFMSTAEQWLRTEWGRTAPDFGFMPFRLSEFENGSGRVAALQSALAELIGRIGELIPTKNGKLTPTGNYIATQTVAVDYKGLKFEQRVLAVQQINLKVNIAWAGGKGNDPHIRKYILAKAGTAMPGYAADNAHPRRTADLRSQLLQSVKLGQLNVVVTMSKTKQQPLTSREAVNSGQFAHDFKGNPINLAMPKVKLEMPDPDEIGEYTETTYPTWDGREAVCWVHNQTRGIVRVPKVMHSGYALKSVLREYCASMETDHEQVDMLWPVQDIIDKGAHGILEGAEPVVVTITHFNGKVEEVEGLMLSDEMSTRWYRSGAFSENTLSSKKIRNIAGSAQWAIRPVLKELELVDELTGEVYGDYSIDQTELNYWLSEIQAFRDITRAKNSEAVKIGMPHKGLTQLKEAVTAAKAAYKSLDRLGNIEFPLVRLDKGEELEDVF